MAEEDNDEEGHLVTYVNQFRLRTCKNVSISLEFFFNDGTLDGNELMYQLFHVQSMLNNVGIDILMLSMDAGGNNTRLAHMLRHEARFGEKVWLGDNENLISYSDPTADHRERSRCTAIVPCSTHN